jgi:hypothetical protein
MKFRSKIISVVPAIAMSMLLLANGSSLLSAGSTQSLQPAAKSPRHTDFKGQSSSASAKARALANYGQRAAAFEANRGQTDPVVKYVANSPRYRFFLTDNEAVFAMSQPMRDKASCVHAKAISSAVIRPSGNLMFRYTQVCDIVIFIQVSMRSIAGNGVIWSSIS